MTDEQTPDHASLGANLTVAPSPTSRKKVAAQGLPTTRRIVLENSENIPPNGLFVGVNGTGYLLRTGVEMNVPLSVVGVLQNSVASFPIRDEAGGIIGYTDRPQYNFRIVE